MDDVLGHIMPAALAAASMTAGVWGSGAATYMLWDLNENCPIYCGTAASPGALRRHLPKDDLANGPIGHTKKNPELRAYCLAQPKGWLGIAFKISPSLHEAKLLERQLIAHYGIRRSGGCLFNQRMSG